MIRHQPTSTAAVFRATHIIGVTVVAASVSEPVAIGGRFLRAELHLELRIEAVFKGVLAAKPGDVLSLDAAQFLPATSFYGAIPGVWSKFEIKSGHEYVLFSTFNVFTEPACFLVDRAKVAVPDIQLIARAEDDQLSLKETMNAGLPGIARWDRYFAQYVEVRLPESFYERFDDFDAVLSAVENPAVSAIAQRMLLTAAYAMLMLHDPAPPNFVARLILASRRVLDSPNGASQRSSVLGTYLPNLLGISSALKPKNREAILAAMPSDRGAIESFLASGGSDAIGKWLRQ